MTDMEPLLAFILVLGLGTMPLWLDALYGHSKPAATEPIRSLRSREPDWGSFISPEDVRELGDKVEAMPRLTCCRRPADITICACRFYPEGMYRDCGRCPKTAPWERCAHWAIQYPDARLLRTGTLHSDDIQYPDMRLLRAGPLHSDDIQAANYSA